MWPLDRRPAPDVLVGLFPAYFLCAVPIAPAVVGAIRGWHWAVRAALQATWLAWFGLVTLVPGASLR